jgi:hypothetical protein
MKTQTFNLTNDHIQLLRRFCVGWQDAEFGAPEIDPKRPYGNSSVLLDIHEILDGEEIDELTDTQNARYSQLHAETELALQIVLSTGKFETGRYECGDYSSHWVKIGEIPKRNSRRLIRKITLECVGDNHSKTWTGELYDNDDVITRWGRLDAELQMKEFRGVGEEFLNKKEKEKLNKGYCPV